MLRFDPSETSASIAVRPCGGFYDPPFYDPPFYDSPFYGSPMETKFP